MPEKAFGTRRTLQAETPVIGTPDVFVRMELPAGYEDGCACFQYLVADARRCLNFASHYGACVVTKRIEI